jgi:hypothetical protein
MTSRRAIVSGSSSLPTWRVLLVFDQTAQGLHGDQEIAAFRALPGFPESASAHLCRLMLMQGLPALLGPTSTEFTGAIGELQRVIGVTTRPHKAEGSRAVEWPRVLAWLEGDGLAGWVRVREAPPDSRSSAAKPGVGNRASAQARAGAARSPLQFSVCGARNRGGGLELAESDPRRSGLDVPALTG